MSEPVGREAWPFYIVCDVSRSMWDPGMNSGTSTTPHLVTSHALPDMLQQLEDDPYARDTAHLAIVTFADDVEVVLPLTHLRQQIQTVPQVPRGTNTQYNKIFQWLNENLRNDLEKLNRQGFKPQNPTIFFITDGNPTRADWAEERQRLSESAFEGRPLIVAFGLGKVTPEVVARIASTNPLGAACISEQDADPGELLEAIIGIIHFS